MSWDRKSSSVRRGRLATFAVLASGSLATAVGASGLRSLVNALEPAAVEAPSVAKAIVPISHGQLPSGFAIAGETLPTSPQSTVPAAPVAVGALAAQPVVVVPIGAPASATRSIASPESPSVFPINLTSAPSTYVATPAPKPTFTLPTPVELGRAWPARGIETLGAPEPRAPRVVATVAGESVQIVDAGPLDELGPIAVGGETRTPSVFRPQRVPSAVGAGVPVEALEPSASDDVADAGAPPVFGPVDHGLPYEHVVFGGNADLVPRWVDNPDTWTPDGPAGDLRDLGFLLDANGEIMTDRDGMPILAPEPSALLTVVAAASLLARRRRRQT